MILFLILPFIAMASDLSPFRKVNIFEAALLSISSRKFGEEEVLHLRLVAKDKSEIPMTLKKDALTMKSQLRERGINTYYIPGKCVKNSNAAMTGVPSSKEIHLQYACKIEAVQEVWPILVSYSLTDFNVMASVVKDAFVDVVGIVTKVGQYAEKSRVRKSDSVGFSSFTFF